MVFLPWIAELGLLPSDALGKALDAFPLEAQLKVVNSIVNHVKLPKPSGLER